jgi:hypothetical protein
MRGLLFALEALLAQRQLVEIHQVAVEIGAVHAGELHLPAHRDAARSAHAGAVYHDGIEAHHGGDAERPGGVAAGLHHGQRPDGHHFANVLFGGQHIGQRLRDEAFAAVAAVVGGDQQLVAVGAEFVFPEHQVAIAEAHDGDGAIAACLVFPQLRIDGSDAQSAAHQHDRAFEFADVAGQPQRPDEIEQGIALAQGHHLKRGFAHGLDHDGDRALFHVESPRR